MVRLTLALACAALAAAPAVAKTRPRTPPPAPPPQVQPSPPPPRPAPVLEGLVDSQARVYLGAADLERAEGAGALWTYRLEGCSLLVFLRRDAGQLKVTGSEAAPRRRGEAQPDREACVREAMERGARGG